MPPPGDFDFTWDETCSDADMQEVLSQIQAAVEYWLSLMLPPIQINLDYEPGFANFASAWINEGGTMPIPDKTKFIWVDSDGFAGEYMAVDGVVTRLENDYYSYKSFFDFEPADPFPVGVDTNDGPEVDAFLQIIRPAKFFVKVPMSIAINAAGAFTGDKIQVVHNFGTSHTATPTNITYAFELPSATGPYAVNAFFHHYAGEGVTPGATYHADYEGFKANAGSYSSAGRIGSLMLPPQSGTPEAATVLAVHPILEVIYGEDV